MKTLSAVYGKKYIPTPVNLHSHNQNTLTDETNNNVTNTWATPTTSPSPSLDRFEQNLLTTKQKTKSKLKKASNATKWSTKKKVIVGAIIATVIVAIIIAAILLGVLLSRKSSGTTTTTTQATVVTIAYWSFDSITTDLYNTYNGALINSATYFATSTNQPYVGVGQGLSLSSASSQYFSVSSPFLDLTYKSFTIETWIYPSISTTADYGIFGQCQCITCSNQCLYFIIRSYALYISFMNNDLNGNTTFTTNTWYHIAFVYNNSTQQQILYVNGYQDGIKSSASSYQGKNGSLWIGASQVFTTIAYFNGYIDNFKITTRAKSATEILNAASLTAYFPFDTPNPTYDSGPLGLNGTANNSAVISGRVNQAMRFSGSSSYFYAYGFYQIGFGVYAGKPFSVSLWINPTIIGAATIVQTAYSLTNYACHNLLGLYSTLGYTMQITAQGWAWPTIYGPMITINTWTHISVTYSLTNGLRLYVNGVYFGYTGTFTFSNTNDILYLQLGYAYYCSSSSITNAGYEGAVDEVYVHSREISQSEVTAFANP